MNLTFIFTNKSTSHKSLSFKMTKFQKNSVKQWKNDQKINFFEWSKMFLGPIIAPTSELLVQKNILNNLIYALNYSQVPYFVFTIFNPEDHEEKIFQLPDSVILKISPRSPQDWKLWRRSKVLEITMKLFKMFSWTKSLLVVVGGGAIMGPRNISDHFKKNYFLVIFSFNFFEILSFWRIMIYEK